MVVVKKRDTEKQNKKTENVKVSPAAVRAMKSALEEFSKVMEIIEARNKALSLPILKFMNTLSNYKHMFKPLQDSLKLHRTKIETPYLDELRGSAPYRDLDTSHYNFQYIEFSTTLNDIREFSRLEHEREERQEKERRKLERERQTERRVFSLMGGFGATIWIGNVLFLAFTGSPSEALAVFFSGLIPAFSYIGLMIYWLFRKP